MNCENCRWYSETFTQHVFCDKIHKGICLLRGCDGSYYEPREEDEQNETIMPD